MRCSDTWVCVADGERARFYCCDGNRELEPVMNFGIPTASQIPFSGRLAGQLDRAARGQMFQHLVLVGPRAFLRELEGTMAGSTRDLIVADMVDKDLWHSTPREASTYLCDVLPS